MNVLNERIDLLLGGKFLFLVLNSLNVWLFDTPTSKQNPEKYVLIGKQSCYLFVMMILWNEHKL